MEDFADHRECAQSRDQIVLRRVSKDAQAATSRHWRQDPLAIGAPARICPGESIAPVVRPSCAEVLSLAQPRASGPDLDGAWRIGARNWQPQSSAIHAQRHDTRRLPAKLRGNCPSSVAKHSRNFWRGADEANVISEDPCAYAAVASRSPNSNAKVLRTPTREARPETSSGAS